MTFCNGVEVLSIPMVGKFRFWVLTTLKGYTIDTIIEGRKTNYDIGMTSFTLIGIEKVLSLVRLT